VRPPRPPSSSHRLRAFPLAEDGNVFDRGRGVEGRAKTTDPYLAGRRRRVVPTLDHLSVRMITYGAIDRAVQGGIADDCGKSTVKNSLPSWSKSWSKRYATASSNRNPAVHCVRRAT
jgi:hypothetical protein